MNIADCKNLGSLRYRRLCQTLSLPPSKEGLDRTGLSGYPETDLIILSNLTDEELTNVCAVNKYVNSVCQDDNFWARRTVAKFGKFLGDVDSIRQYIPEKNTWKDYYLWLSAMQNADSRLVHQLALLHQRDDLLLVLGDLPHLRIYNNFPPSPVYITEHLKNFFKEADLGLSDPSNPYSVSLADVIDLTVTSRDILRQLFQIYIAVNNMRYTDTGPRIDDRTNPVYLAATPLMYRYFNDMFTEEIERRRQNRGGRGRIDRTPIFDPSKFKFNDLYTLVRKKYIIPADQLTPEQVSAINDPAVRKYIMDMVRYLQTVYHLNTKDRPYNYAAADV